jgi:CO/xanthine dehydrogenase FAD-binding subunit
VRAYPAEYALVAPRTLPAVLSLLAQDPGAWLPIAGGTDVMVQYSAGKLPARKLVSIWNFPELRRIDIAANEIQIGAGCTYTDLRENEDINHEFSLLASAAAWTGGIANQNRGTIGGNIVNASPAADSLPALMAYEAELLLVSAEGERRVPYVSFHIGYRKTQLAPSELIRAVCLKKQFSGYYAHARKVGARNAQAISKVFDRDGTHRERKAHRSASHSDGEKGGGQRGPSDRRHSLHIPVSRGSHRKPCRRISRATERERGAKRKRENCAGTMERSAARKSRRGNLALLLFKSLGPRDGESSADPRRVRPLVCM